MADYNLMLYWCEGTDLKRSQFLGKLDLNNNNDSELNMTSFFSKAAGEAAGYSALHL